MSSNPYNDGRRDYERCWTLNPYKDEHRRAEWKRGYDDADTAELGARENERARRDNLWNVPERAKDEYMAMEDNFSPATILDFMLAMHPEDDAA